MNIIKAKLTETHRVFNIESIQEKLESVMPEVRRQVRVYEKKLKAGKLSATPKSHPLFGK